MSVFLDLKKSVPTFIDEECGIISNESFHKIYREDFLNRVFNIMCVAFREFTYSLKALVKNTILINNSKSYATLPADTQNSSLVICFHGLNGRPSVWNGHIDKIEELNKKGENIAIYSPKLPRLGHVATNDNEMQQIYNTILYWVKYNQGKPITVFGQSNGGRFALALEYFLREKAPKTPVHLSLTGGVFYGTSKINQITKRISPEKLEKYTGNLITITACNELTLGSEPSKKLLKNARKPLLNNVAERRYRMYASPNDAYVPEHGSSLSFLCSNENNPQKNEKHYFVPGYGHNSLVDSVVDKQISKMIHFFKRKNSNRFDKMHCKHCHKIKGFVLNIDDSTQKIKLGSSEELGGGLLT